MSAPRLLAIDQGTTSSRAIVFDASGQPLARSQTRLPQAYPHPGWVEHDPARLFGDTIAACRDALDQSGTDPADVTAVGITNQRETTLLWERATGRPVHPAIVWQDRRTAAACEALRAQGAEELARERTGLLLDPYFSATKLAWLLEHVEGAREAAGRGDLAFGTVDCWLVWNLTGGSVHATDATNASRTLLFDIHRQCWDEELLELFGIPASVLPEVRDSAGSFGEVDPDLLGAPIQIAGVAGDQQAATFGQAAFRKGLAKCTYGTGAFLLLNTGPEAVLSRHRLLTTVAWRLDGRPTYALEGSIFSAGSAVDWLRDGLGLVERASEVDDLAAGAREDSQAVMVPAFTGLGAPHWDPDARGALLGLTRDTGPAEIARATLESVGFQTLDLLEAMKADTGVVPDILRVDGGLSRSERAMSFLADVLERPVERPVVTETTALGAAYLAGLAVGVYGDLEELEARWSRDRRWEPSMGPEQRRVGVERWRRAVGRVLTRPPEREPED